MPVAVADTVALLCDARASIGETPVWRDGQIIWTDPVSRRLPRLDRDGQFASTVAAATIWSLGLMPDGTLVGALDDRFCRIDDKGEVEPGPPAAVAAGCRFNDITVGADGALWVGAMHKGVLATTGAIFRAATLDREPVRVASGLGIPNGMALSADGRTLFVIDTLARTLLAFAVVGDTLAEPVIVTDFLNVPGKPDGMALARDGSFRVAMWGGGCVAHIAADGATLGWTDIPAPHVSSVCFAGPNRLLATTSRMRLSPAALAEAPGSGGLFELMLDETGSNS